MSEKRFELSEIYSNTIMDTENCINNGSHCRIYDIEEVVDLLNEQQSTINELQSIINHIKCEENCFDYDYCCETVCSLYNEIRHLKEENEQLRKQINEYNLILKQHEFAEKEGFQ